MPPAAGDADLRRALADYLQGTRGVVCAPEQIVITSGTQQSLHLVAQLLADPGDAVWLEDPGYWGARSVFRALGLEAGAGARSTAKAWRRRARSCASRRARCSSRRRTNTRPAR